MPTQKGICCLIWDSNQSSRSFDSEGKLVVDVEQLKGDALGEFLNAKVEENKPWNQETLVGILG